MPYYLINKEPVFLTNSRYKDLERIVSVDKDIRWIAVSAMQGSKEGEEKSLLMYTELDKQYMRDPDKFYSDWIEFDISGKEAEENLWDLLFDYGAFYDNSYLSDNRDFVEQFSAEYEGESYLYPMGKVFNFNILIQSNRLSISSLIGKKKNYMQLIINVQKVKRLMGTLRNFTAIFETYELDCGESIRLVFK